MEKMATDIFVENAPSQKPTKVKSVLIGVHCQLALADAIDDYISDNFNMMKRPEAIRSILIESLAAKGYLQRERPTHTD